MKLIEMKKIVLITTTLLLCTLTFSQEKSQNLSNALFHTEKKAKTSDNNIMSDLGVLIGREILLSLDKSKLKMKVVKTFNNYAIARVISTQFFLNFDEGYAFINSKKEIVSDFYKKIEIVKKHNLVKVQLEDYSWTLLNSNLKSLQRNLTSINSNFRKGYTIASKKREKLLKTEYLNGVIDTKGNTIVPFEFDNINMESSNKGLFIVQKDKKWGIHNSKLNKTYEPKFKSKKYEESAMFKVSFSDGLCPFANGDKWGFIDEKMNIIIPFKYDQVLNFQNDFVKVRKKRKWGVLDKKGNIIIPVKYQNIKVLRNSFFIVNHNEKSAVLDKKGNIIIPFKYKYIRDFNHDSAIVYNNKYWGVINLKDEIIIKFKYDHIEFKNKNTYKVVLPNRKFLIINEKEEIIKKI